MDWRTSVARESRLILEPLGYKPDWLAFADAWRNEYQPGMEEVRSGKIPFSKQTITVREGRANVFVAVEHANSEVVGIHASRSANRFEALEPVRQAVHRCFGAIAPGVARGLKLRHDHGSNYMSGDFQNEIKCLGIEASPSFVREPQGNGVAERFIRTLKENLLWVRTFDTIEELRAALIEFARHYNENWLVARHGHRTPAQVRANQYRLDQNATAAVKLAA